MGKRKPAVLCTAVDCEWRDGLVQISVASGECRRRGWFTLSLAMLLHHRLGVIIDKAVRHHGDVLSAKRNGG